jgi:hypothetical protein
MLPTSYIEREKVGMSELIDIIGNIEKNRMKEEKPNAGKR